MAVKHHKRLSNFHARVTLFSDGPAIGKYLEPEKYLRNTGRVRVKDARTFAAPERMAVGREHNYYPGADLENFVYRS